MAGEIPRAHADDVLHNPGSLAAREHFWTAPLTEERFHQNRIAVAERGGRVIGAAMSGPPQDADARWGTQLYVLYVFAVDRSTSSRSTTAQAQVQGSSAPSFSGPNQRFLFGVDPEHLAAMAVHRLLAKGHRPERVCRSAAIRFGAGRMRALPLVMPN
jgi:hypothetical protein